jgi:hypothetical protein
MTPDEVQKTQRLYELLVGRAGRKEQLRKLTELCESFEGFRVSLVCQRENSGTLSGVLADWRRRIAAWVTELDDRKLLHDLEILSLKQIAIEKLLEDNEAALMSKLRALDADATGLAELTQRVRDMRTAIEEHRQRLSHLALGSH